MCLVLYCFKVLVQTRTQSLLDGGREETQWIVGREFVLPITPCAPLISFLKPSACSLPRLKATGYESGVGYHCRYCSMSKAENRFLLLLGRLPQLAARAVINKGLFPYRFVPQERKLSNPQPSPYFHLETSQSSIACPVYRKQYIDNSNTSQPAKCASLLNSTWSLRQLTNLRRARNI